ncbi:MAG: SPOR domain-containing protein [Raineya sp.]|nr:SPOR domain-containing protein [Raineya sp.]MDW8296903.1 SPOR domain-containing protein [Raineya sp.]
MKKLLLLFCGILLQTSLWAQKNKKEAELTFSDSVQQYLPVYQYQRPIFKGKHETYEIIRNIENVNLPDSMLNFKYSITASLNKILDTKPEDITVKLEKPGFRVQVYSGKDREEAQRIKGLCLNMKIDEDVTAYIEYDRPNYKVKVGDFLTREDARELYRQLKKRFPEALIVPDIVTVIKKATPDELIMLRRKEAEEKLRRGQK